mgnify:CR=1 FL=1
MRGVCTRVASLRRRVAIQLLLRDPLLYYATAALRGASSAGAGTRVSPIPETRKPGLAGPERDDGRFRVRGARPRSGQACRRAPVDRGSGQAAQERHAFGHANDGDHVGRLGGDVAPAEPGSPCRRRSRRRRRGRRGPSGRPRSSGTPQLGRHGQGSARRAALDDEPALAHERRRTRPSSCSGPRRPRRPSSSSGLEPNRLTSTVAVFPPERVGEPDRRVLDLAPPGLAAQLRGDLRHLRRARRADRVPLGLESAGRVDGDPAAEARLPFSAAMPPVPGSQRPSPSVARISAIVKQSWSSTTSTSGGPSPACR